MYPLFLCSHYFTSGTGTRFIVKMDDTAMEGDDAEEEEEESARQGKGGLSERCRFWPNCKNGDSCPFHHPTVPCRYVVLNP